MRKRKSFNKYPYLLLFIFHTVLLTFTFNKHKSPKRLFILLVSNIGMAYIFDFIVVILFKGYQYKPAIFKNHYLDSILGAILSQAVFVPFSALFLSAFHLKWKVKLLFVLYFGYIEKLFVKMGIYKQYWWKTYYTMILLPIYFWISDQWNQHLKKGTPFVLFLSLIFLNFVTCINLLFLRAVKGNMKFGNGVFHSWREHFTYSSLYSIVTSFFTAWILKDKRGFSKVRILSFRLLVDYILLKWKKLKVKKEQLGMNFLFNLLLTYISEYYSKLLYKERKVEIRK